MDWGFLPGRNIPGLTMAKRTKKVVVLLFYCPMSR